MLLGPLILSLVLVVVAVSGLPISPASTYQVDEVIKTSDLSSISIPSYRIVQPASKGVNPKIEYDFLPFISAPPLKESDEVLVNSASAESEEPNRFGIVESDESEEELLNKPLLPLLPAAETAVIVVPTTNSPTQLEALPELTTVAN
ncbi:hypothetical protein DAPPUDRAFT_227837 [Daphnia pulex]|uniref:DUF4794 domain-containing protein n=1 Tax=Daphnia pulex TaxID=6669 RepID=E9H9G9_DAPPU|nr:hypothetical protein DAPPUDRAFT_227837 [Daphnia pulex]|eukprot:EFX71615.1 hypothetical protein DAPPUDRAFT_227837 [Daphnia pulex]